MVPSETVSKIIALCYATWFCGRMLQTSERARLESPQDPKGQHELKKLVLRTCFFSVDSFLELYAACVKRSLAINSRAWLYMYTHTNTYIYIQTLREVQKKRERQIYVYTQKLVYWLFAARCLPLQRAFRSCLPLTAFARVAYCLSTIYRLSLLEWISMCIGSWLSRRCGLLSG